MTESVIAGRALMADSLGFHIIFALLGVGLPLVILLIEWLGIRRKNLQLIEHARRLSYVATVLIVAGVVSGTIISIQMATMWAGLVKFGGPILGLAFGWEGYAFMLEAVFMAFYVSTWGKIKGFRHWIIGVPVALGSLGSAFAITLGNAWMQNPTGFELVSGQVVTSDVIGALFTKTAFFMIAHSVIGYYIATVLLVLGGYALYVWRKRPSGLEGEATRVIMFRLAMTAVVLSLSNGLLGHLQTQYLADSQPRKFAALEMVEKTTANAPYIIGGEWTQDGKVEGGIRIPSLLSFLAGNTPDKVVRGLNDFPKSDWPMLFINTLFEAKLILYALIIAIPMGFIALHLSKLPEKLKNWRLKKPMLLALIVSGPLAIIVVELGWMVAEFGRQPFVVNGYLRTAAAFTGAAGIGSWGYVFPLLFVLLFIVTVVALKVLFKRMGHVKVHKKLRGHE